MKRRFVVSLILAVFLLSVFTCAVSAAATPETATVKVDTISAWGGDTVSLAVSIENNPGIMSAYFDVEYSKDLTLVSCENQGLWGKGDVYLASTPKNNAFVVSWDHAKTKENIDENGTLLILTFQVAKTATGTLSVSLKQLNDDADNVINNELKPITVNYTSGGVIVETLKLTKVTRVSNGLKLEWNALKDAENYRVYRRVAGTSNWGTEIAANVTATSYVDTKAASGVSYEYTVAAFKNSNKQSTPKASALSGWWIAPAKLKSAVNVAGGIQLSWNKVGGAAGYRVERKEGNGSWKPIKDIPSGSTVSYLDTTAKAGTVYQYRLQAYKGNVKSASGNVIAVQRLTQPTVKVANVATGITASWNKVAGAKGYYVYRQQYSGGKWSGWKEIKTTTAVSYTDKTAKAGVSYQYTVKAYNGSCQSSFKGVSIVRLAQPTVKTANAATGITASWNKVAGAKGYYVYRQQYSGGKWSGWKKIKTTTAVSYTDKTAKAGVSYQYTVKAYNGSYQSSFKGVSIVRLTQPAVKAAKVSSGIKSSWNKVTGAKGYYVYRRQYSGGKWSGWQKIKTTSSVSYTDKTAKKGVKYQYTARAYSGKYQSSFKASTTVKR